MFEGACYVVSANDRLDYFGQTVNVASRVQHLANAGELVMARATYESLGDALAASGAGGPRVRLVERLEARVKGIDAPLALVRLTLGNSAAG
jgi:adenylate cyclase